MFNKWKRLGKVYFGVYEAPPGSKIIWCTLSFLEKTNLMFVSLKKAWRNNSFFSLFLVEKNENTVRLIKKKKSRIYTGSHTPLWQNGQEVSVLTYFVGCDPLSLFKPLSRFPPAAEMRKGELAGLADWRSVLDGRDRRQRLLSGKITHSSPQHKPPPEEVRMYFTHHYALETRRANQACNLLPLSKPLADKHSAALANGVLHFRFQWEFSGGRKNSC